MTVREAVGQLATLLEARTLEGVLSGASALERGDRRGARLILRHATELRRLASYRGAAVEVLLSAAGAARPQEEAT